MKNICVFCGSSRGFNNKYSEPTRELAKIFAKKNLNLVYGGANIGLMKVIADAVLKNGSEVYGVMPKNLAEREIAHSGITKMHIVETMAQRKQVMADISDAFVILPGGVGTMDELFEILSWNQLGFMKKPVGIYNIDGFFNHLIDYLDHAIKEKFLRQEHRDNMIVDDNPESMMKKLLSFTFIEPEKWVERLREKGY